MTRLLDDVNRLVWMVTYYWISFFDMEGKALEDRYLEGTRLCVRAFEPYLTDEVRRDVKNRLEELSRT